MDRAKAVPTKLILQAIAGPLALAVLFPVLGWVNYVAYAHFGKDFIGTRGSAGYDKMGIYLMLAVGLTVIGLGGGALVAWRHVHLVRTGVRVPGRLAGRGRGSYRGMVDAVVKYEVGGRTYTQAQTTSPELIRNFEGGQPCTVYADPRKPKRALVMWVAYDAGVAA